MNCLRGEGRSVLRFHSRKPAIVILDLSLPDLFTMEIVRMREAEAFTRIMVLSTRRDSRTIVDALRAGVKCASSQIRACVSFARSPQQILGGIFVSPDWTLRATRGPRGKMTL